jgi:valyl-tRNA synthetase
VVADLKALGLLVESQEAQADGAALRAHRPGGRAHADRPVVRGHVQGQPQDPTGKSIAQKAIDAVQRRQVRFVPENWVNTYNQWMNNIQDWCISRQLWWGHQIPAWYGEQRRTLRGHATRPHARAQADGRATPGKKLRRDEDVLDTWYSSALVPFSTMGWPAAAAEPAPTGGD